MYTPFPTDPEGFVAELLKRFLAAGGRGHDHWFYLDMLRNEVKDQHKWMLQHALRASCKIKQARKWAERNKTWSLSSTDIVSMYVRQAREEIRTYRFHRRSWLKLKEVAK